MLALLHKDIPEEGAPDCEVRYVGELIIWDQGRAIVKTLL